MRLRIVRSKRNPFCSNQISISRSRKTIKLYSNLYMSPHNKFQGEWIHAYSFLRRKRKKLIQAHETSSAYLVKGRVIFVILHMLRKKFYNFLVTSSIPRCSLILMTEMLDARFIRRQQEEDDKKRVGIPCCSTRYPCQTRQMMIDKQLIIFLSAFFYFLLDSKTWYLTVSFKEHGMSHEKNPLTCVVN